MTNNYSKISEIKVLQEGSKDARYLLILWFFRRLFWPLILLGVIGYLLNEDLGNNELDFTNIESVAAKLLSPLVGLGVALFVKFAAGYIAIIIAYPLLQERRKVLKDEKYGWFLSRWLDRYRILKGFSEIRWSHHVRQEAINRVKDDVIKWDKLDKYFDILTILLVVILVAVTFTLAGE